VGGKVQTAARGAKNHDASDEGEITPHGAPKVRAARRVLDIGQEVEMASESVKKELLELERQYWQALKDNDVQVVERLTANPCIVTGPQGIGQLEKQHLIEMMKTATYTLDSFELKPDMKVQMLSDDVGVVAYEVHEEMTVDGKTVELDAAEASTWVKEGDHWVCALHTEALRGDPFGRDRAARKPS
jgi:hypothetical protein